MQTFFTECLRCGYQWEARKPHPVQCARCKSLRWDEPWPTYPPRMGAPVNDPNRATKESRQQHAANAKKAAPERTYAPLED